MMLWRWHTRGDHEFSNSRNSEPGWLEKIKTPGIPRVSGNGTGYPTHLRGIRQSEFNLKGHPKAKGLKEYTI